VSLTGIGPEVHLDVFGTGFLASDDGQILTNHHVAEPWWQNDELKEMLDQDLEPEIAEMTAYFPDITHGIPISTKKRVNVAQQQCWCPKSQRDMGLIIRKDRQHDTG
jgi:hypothetical protein